MVCVGHVVDTSCLHHVHEHVHVVEITHTCTCSEIVNDVIRDGWGLCNSIWALKCEAFADRFRPDGPTAAHVSP